ncbi:MAG TPA: BTAD domain-containing putative transcriptional regulator [Mycobacteriales bacterium]|nr:BTAD domain-containing putative transcriptional regulator [Mycobacteriales bacterium]
MFFGILGAVEAWRPDGTVVAVGGPRVRALLAVLLLDAGRVVGTERLIDSLYGQRPPADAANALQSQVSRLRRGLGDAGAVVQRHPGGYRLDVEPGDVDAGRFQELREEGRLALAAGERQRAADRLGAALALWRGPALADVPGVSAPAARLEELRAATVEDHAEALVELGRHREVVPELQELVGAYPLRERPRAQLMRALYGSGRQAEALAVFEDARRTLADELGADPSAELTETQLAVLRADPELGPAAGPAAGPAETAPATPALARPPAQLTSFVGRAEELREIEKALGRARLVTLLGPGGAGKTRLAIEASRQLPDELCFVDLAPIEGGAPGTGDAVAQAMLGALGLRESGLLPTASAPADAAARLIAALTDRLLLLVIDNCEHVIGEVAALAGQLLGACPRLRVLATSREPLGITGEALRPLQPLASPPPETAAVAASSYPAVRLFVDRAAAVAPDFALDDGNLATVLRICAALDGLPLAIELAAARLRSLTVEQVAARLDDRFGLLSRGDRTKAPRHQTLRAVVAWSWSLLSEPERQLAARLTVFAGGATAAAVATVCVLSEGEAVELLADLVDKSLVETGDGRYRMLDTIRVYCAERLAETGDAERLRAAHVGYFTELASVAESHLRSAEQLDWLAVLTVEHGNLMAALRWAVQTDTAAALRLLALLSPSWWLRGLRSEGVPIAAELLVALGRRPPDGMAEEYVLCVLAALAGGGRTETYRAELERAGAIVNALGWPPRYPFLTVLWAVTVGPPPDNRAAEIENIEIGPDTWSRALTHLGRGFQRLFTGDRVGGEQSFAASLVGFREAGDRWGMSQALDQLAMLADWRGDRPQALTSIDEAIGLIGQLGASEDESDLFARRADLLIRDGDLNGAEADYRHSGELASRAGAVMALTAARRGLGELARLRGELTEARRMHEETLRTSASDWAAAETRSRILTALGHLAVIEGDPARARDSYRAALDLMLSPLNLPVAATAIEGMAGLAALEGDGERSATLLGAGRALRGVSIPGDPDATRAATAARALIGAEAYEAALSRGAALSREEALALAGA